MLVLLLITTGSSQSQDKKLQYELSERCGKRVEEIRNQLSDTSKYPHISHYNFSLNKCFFLQTQSNETTKMYRLCDANEQSLYGIYLSDPPIFKCEVLRASQILDRIR